MIIVILTPQSILFHQLDQMIRIFYDFIFFSLSYSNIFKKILVLCLFDYKSPLVQSEDDASLSGVPVTALFFDIDLRLLISGDQSGMVKCSRFENFGKL